MTSLRASTAERPARRLVPSLVWLSYTLLVAAWIFGNPPYSAPDEWSHYLRAVSLGHGQLVGLPAGLEGARAIVGATRPSFLTEKTYQDELTWVAQNTRRVRIPAGLTPGWFRCPLTDPKLSARCLNESPPLDDAHDWFNPTATYQPFSYLVPAAIARINLHPDNLTRLMRVGKAILNLALVGAAVFLLWNSHAGLASLTGLLVAITPMALFLSATLNPSGLEIVAAIAFASALLRITRTDAENRFAWTIAASSGVVLALSRSTAPLWIVLSVALILLTSGMGGFLRTAQRRRRWALPALGAVAAAIFLNRLWERLYGPVLAFDLTPVGSSLYAGLGQLPHVLLGQIGVFNYLEFGLPVFAHAIWGTMAVALGVTALLAGTTQERLLLLTSLVLALALPVFLFAGTLRHTGFGMQGRYVLAFSILVPLIAGEILVRRYPRLQALAVERYVIVVSASAGLVHVIAWWTNARRFAVGLNGPQWFLNVAEWSPPSGWWPWLILTVGGASLLAGAAVVDWYQRRRSESTAAGSIAAL